MTEHDPKTKDPKEGITFSQKELWSDGKPDSWPPKVPLADALRTKRVMSAPEPTDAETENVPAEGKRG